MMTDTSMWTEDEKKKYVAVLQKTTRGDQPTDEDLAGLPNRALSALSDLLIRG